MSALMARERKSLGCLQTRLAAASTSEGCCGDHTPIALNSAPARIGASTKSSMRLVGSAYWICVSVHWDLIIKNSSFCGTPIIRNETLPTSGE